MFMFPSKYRKKFKGGGRKMQTKNEHKDVEWYFNEL